MQAAIHILSVIVNFEVENISNVTNSCFIDEKPADFVSDGHLQGCLIIIISDVVN